MTLKNSVPDASPRRFPSGMEAVLHALHDRGASDIRSLASPGNLVTENPRILSGVVKALMSQGMVHRVKSRGEILVVLSDEGQSWINATTRSGIEEPDRASVGDDQPDESPAP